MTEKQTNRIVEDVEWYLRSADEKMCKLHSWIMILRQRDALSRKTSTRDLRVIHRIRERLARLNGLLKCLEDVPESVGVWVSQDERR
jgi:hypothetical protein